MTPGAPWAGRWPAAPAGIRPRLALLSLLASGPLVLLLMAGAVAERSRTVAAAAVRAQTLAVLGAEQQDDLIQEAATLLRVLARVPDIRVPLARPCHALLRRVEEDHQRIGILSVIGSDGRVACNSRDEQPSLALADRPYFQQAMAARTDELILSTPVMSRMTGKPTIVAAVPLFPTSAFAGASDAGGAKPDGLQAEGVLIAALDLDWFSRLGTRLPGSGTNLVQIIDLRDGSAFARSVLDGAGVAAAQPGITLRQADPALAAAARAAGGPGTMQGPDPAGIGRITGFAPLPGTGGTLVLSVGLPRQQVLSAANARLAEDAAIAAAATASALLLAWSVANRAVLRPVRRMAAAAGQLGAGNLDTRVAALPGAARELQALAANLDDMTARLQARSRDLAAAQASLQRSEEHHRLLSTHSSDMISRFDSRFRLTYLSPACLDLTGYQPDELIGRPTSDLVHPDDLAWVDETLNAPLQAGRPTARATYRAVRKDGAVAWLESIVRWLPDVPTGGTGGDGSYVMVTRDVSTRMEMEQRLEEANTLLRGQAMQDPLTALPNRRHIDEAIGTEFRRAQRLQLPLGILMLDIDRFKAFNDTYGHPAGDACIRAVATAIKAVLRRPTDLAGRYGGEEFAVLLPNTDDAGVAVTGERIRRAVQDLGLAHTGSEFGIVTLSIGAAAIMPPIGDIGPAAFLEAADAALYAAKRAGRNGLRLAAVAVTAAGQTPALRPDHMGG